MRKFGAANTGVILSLQDQVANLEEQLAEIDNGTSWNGPRDNRRKVIEKLQNKLNEYSTLPFPTDSALWCGLLVEQ